MGKLELLKNLRGFSNTEYGFILDYLLELKALQEKIIKVNEPDYEVEVDEGFTREEAISLEYIDELEGINWQEFNKIANQVAAEIFFPNTGVTSLFMMTLESMKFQFSKLQQKLNYMQEFNFDSEFREVMLKDLANLNYCILCSYRMFSISSGKILNCLQEYCAVRNLEPEEFYKEMYEYYKEHRPSLALFEKYPELAIALETKIDPEYFETIVAYSSYLSKKELQGIANEEIIVDDAFISMLEERIEDIKNGGNN